MRNRFNEGGYFERMKRGEFTAVIIKERAPKPEILTDYGADTRSLVIHYFDNQNQMIAEVHQYVDLDGNILYINETGQLCRDGKPDPKILFEGGILYRQVSH